MINKYEQQEGLMKNNKTLDWILRVVKGMLIGTGAILPGVSGGALAAVFGLYERIISFLAHLTKDFKKNFIFFLPVGIGGVLGIYVLSHALSYFFEHAEAQLLWFFVGCIAGITPALYKQAGKKGRKPTHLAITSVSFGGAVLLLWNLQALITAKMPLNFATWVMAGGIFALGIIVPGLSPSNFLLYLGMYDSMTNGIKSLDFMVIIPLLLGAVITVLLFSKLFDWLFGRFYSGMFHFILGVVLASTVLIIPRDYSYFSLGGLGCLVLTAAGVALGAFMSRLEDKYKET